MKKNIINCFLLSALLFVGCKKNDSRYPFDVALARVPYVNVTTDPTGSAAIDVLNLANFAGKYTVDVLYKSDAPPSKVDLVVIKNGVKSSVKVLQTGVTTFPATFTITTAQLATLFGATVKLGDNYDIGVDIYTQDGTKYEAFPNASSGLLAYSGTGQANQPGFSPTTRFSAICAYDPSIYQGNFVVVSDAFGELNPGDVLTFTKVSNSSFSFIYIHPNLTAPLPVLVTVNTGNNIVSIAKQKVGTKFYTFDNLNFTATSLSNNFVAPCNQTVTLNITYTVDQGSFGSAVLVLKKQ